MCLLLFVISFLLELEVVSGENIRCSHSLHLFSSDRTKLTGFITRNSSSFFENAVVMRPIVIREPNKVNCTWKLRVPEGKFIRFRFQWMNFKWCANCHTCDSVRIGKLAAAPESGSGESHLFCTPSAPQHTFTTISNEAEIVFTVIDQKSKEASHSSYGFNLTFHEVEEFHHPNDTVSCQNNENNTSTELLNLPMGATGAIYSYKTSNGTYRPNEHCNWLISADDPYAAIRFELVFVNIEDACSCYDSIAMHAKICDRFCQHDYLNIYDGKGDSGSTRPLIMKRCGFSAGRVMPCTAVTSWNEGLVVFHTNHRLQYGGFILLYKVVEADQFPCALFTFDWKMKHQINASLKSSGTVASYKRHRDGRYRVHTRCRWLADFYPKVFSFKFLHFDLGGECSKPKGCLDRLHLEDFNFTFYGKHYSNKTYYLDVKPGGSAIDFDTMSSFGHYGWNFSYLAVNRTDIETCTGPKIIDGTLVPTDVIRNYVRECGTYRTPDSCSWHILGPKGSTIQFTLAKLDIDPRDGHAVVGSQSGETICKNHLSIYEIIDEHKTSARKILGPLCGFNSAKQVFQTTSNDAIVTFTTNNTDEPLDPVGNGFEITYAIMTPVETQWWDMSSTVAILISVCVGVAVIGLMSVILTQQYYARMTEELRQRRLKLADTILGEHYIVPLPDHCKILDQLGRTEYGELVSKITILPEQIQFQTDEEQLIGEGRFGTVRRALFTLKKGSVVEVAVKTLKEKSGNQLALFLREGLLMHLLDHENILKVYGILLVDETKKTPGIVFPFMANGSLHDFLDNLSEEEVKKYDEGGTFVDFCRQICAGMVHLADHGCVHRDLACRNILVSGDLCLKISDFGFARELNGHNYYRITESSSQLVPFRWYPPEAFQEPFLYTTKSDVWSFGVLCWEIFEIHHVPYEGKNAHQIIKAVCRGERLPKPKRCPEKLYYEVIIRCWSHEMVDRPSFAELHQKIAAISGMFCGR